MAKQATTKTKVTGKAFDWSLAKRLLSYTRPYRGLFGLALMITISLALLRPVRPWLFQYMLDNEISLGDVSGLRTLVLLTIGILVVEALLAYASTYLTNWLGQSVIRDIRNQVYRHIVSMKLQYFDRTPIGQLQTRTISDVETLNDVFKSGLVRILGDLLQVFAILGVMLYTSWKLTLIVLISLPFLLLATYIFKVKVKAAFQKVRESVSEMNTFLQEHITGMQIVHIFNREGLEQEGFDKINLKLRSANLNSVLYYSVFFPAVEIISALGMALLVWYGASQVLAQEITFGVLTAFVMYLQMFFRPIRMLADQFNILQLGMVSAERVFKVLDTDAQIADTGKDKIDQSHAISLDFKEVSFAYNEPEWVLRDINLSVTAGQKVALVGSTGSGKTTIINLVSRFYEFQKGEIQLNGNDIRSYSIDELRKQIGVVLQDVFLFSGSIYDNITLNNDQVPLETVQAAARRVGAHDFIMQLPGGYDYNVQERGATLSMGQRQLIAFARVLVYNPQVLVLDEATANVDSESEELIQQAIDTLMKGRTSIIIAHRLSTIQKADKIVVLDKGSIIESGNHQELLRLKGKYFELHEMQLAS